MTAGMGRWTRGLAFQALLRRAPVAEDGVSRIDGRRIYILPTGTGALYGAVAFLMLIGSLNYQNNLSLLFTFLMVSVGLVAMHHCWFNLLGLEVQARPGPPVLAGSAARFEIVLHNTRATPRWDLLAEGGLEPAWAARIEGSDRAALSLCLPTERRGLLQLEEVRIRTLHPMGLFRAWCYASCRAAVLVYPRPAPSAPPPEPAPGDGRLPGPAGGEGADDFLGPREYRRGDSPRRVDWKAAARGRGLVVKQFGGDRHRELILDWDLTPGGDPEWRISLLARQALDAGEAQVRFGLRLPGVSIEPDRGEAQVRVCLGQLALFDHGQGQAGARRAGP